MANIKHVRDATANDADKIVLTCPDYKLQQVLQAHVELITTATVGNRRIRMVVQDENDVLVADYHAGAVQAASLTRHYVYGQGVFRETAFIDTEIHVPFPFETILLPGWDLRFLDDSGIDLAADDMTVNLIYRETDHTDVEGM